MIPPVDTLKAMVVVLSIAIAVFVLLKPVCLRFMAIEDFARRRNAWLALTLVAYLTPNFWLFSFVAFPLLYWSAKKDANPVALYVLVMNVLPPSIGADIPVIGINALFDVNTYRLLSFAILIPTAWRVIQSEGRLKLTLMDGLILSYGLLHLLLLVPYESFTHTMRRTFLFTIDVLVLYFVVSRVCVSRRAISETVATFCLLCAILAPLALFESIKGWLLYQGIGEHWGDPIPFAYILREGILRAQVSAGHSIPLGFMFAVGFGFWLYVQSRVQGASATLLGAIWLWAGLLAAYSRAPWVVAVAILFTYLALSPKAAARLAIASLACTILAGLILASPVGDRVIDNLPFIGTVDPGNVTYRQRLAEMSWELIKQNPLFGSPFVLLYLEELRQGQGIIDLMNTYASIAMFDGLIGLFLFIGFFAIGMKGVHRLGRQASYADLDLSFLGASLFACMLGTLVMMATGSFGGALAKVFYLLAGLAAGYSQLSLANKPLLGLNLAAQRQ